MKRLFSIFIVISSLATAGASLYAYFIYIPKEIEQKIITGFYELGFENLRFGEIIRKNGETTFFDISLDNQNLSTIGELKVRGSLPQFLLNPDRIQKIIIRNMSLTGELSEDFGLSISGWREGKQSLQNFHNIPTDMIVIENSSIDLLSDTLSGITIKYNGQIQLLNSGDIEYEDISFSPF